MTPPIRPIEMSDADLWEHFRSKGLSVDAATQHVERRRRGQSGIAKGEQELSSDRPSLAGTIAVNFGQGASLGAADDISDALNSNNLKNLPGLVASYMGGRGATTPPARPWTSTGEATGYLQQSFAAHPLAAGLSQGVGMGATGVLLAPLTAGMGAVATGATIGGVTNTVKGALDPLPGMSRAVSAIAQGTVGAVVGGFGGKLLSKVIPWGRTFGGNIMRGVMRQLGKKTADVESAQLSESMFRSFMTERGMTPEAIEVAVQGWRSTLPKSALPPAPAAPPAPPTLRPGETVEQIAPKGLAISGPRATPPVPTTPTILEMQGMGNWGKGQTLPYYPRGGVAEQAMAPTPQSTIPRLAPNQNQAFAEFLKGATPEDVGSRVGTLRALGVPLPPNAEAELLAYLMGAK